MRKGGEKERKREGKKRKGRDSLDLLPQEKFSIATPMQNECNYTQKSFSFCGTTYVIQTLFQGFVPGPH